MIDDNLTNDLKKEILKQLVKEHLCGAVVGDEYIEGYYDAFLIGVLLLEEDGYIEFTDKILE